MSYTTMKDIYRKSLAERRVAYGVYDIDTISVDGMTFGGYKAYSAFWEKTYPVSPERTLAGVIDNLNSLAFFTTFHLRINFSMMSIDDYRRLYELMLSKNEFVVTCYDPLSNSKITQKMYFYPDDLPNFYMPIRAINGEKFFELTGVKDYVVEMVGTNADPDTATVLYYDPNGNLLGSGLYFSNTEVVVGEGIVAPIIDGYTFYGAWKRSGNDMLYLQDDAYFLRLTDAEKRTNTVTMTAVYKKTIGSLPEEME